MKTYSFRVVVERDGDRWHSCCPALKSQGAVSWGQTEEEALRNIQEVVQMVVEEILEDRKTLPVWPEGEVAVFPDSRVAVLV